MVLALPAGLIDAPFLNLTPGTRNGIIHDDRYAALLKRCKPLETHVNGLIEAQQRAEEEQASQQSLQRDPAAFREALLALPPEEYDWFDVQARPAPRADALRAPRRRVGLPQQDWQEGIADLGVAEPTHSQAPNGSSSITRARSSVSSSLRPPAHTPLNEHGTFRALPRDRSRRRVIDDLTFTWEIVEGEGSLAEHDRSGSRVLARQPSPGLARLKVIGDQREVTCHRGGPDYGHRQLETLNQLRRPSTRVACPATHSNGRPANCGDPGSTWSAISSSSTAGIAISFSRPKPGAAAALPRAALRQGARAQELRGIAPRSAA